MPPTHAAAGNDDELEIPPFRDPPDFKIQFSPEQARILKNSTNPDAEVVLGQMSVLAQGVDWLVEGQRQNVENARMLEKLIREREARAEEWRAGFETTMKSLSNEQGALHNWIDYWDAKGKWVKWFLGAAFVAVAGNLPQAIWLVLNAVWSMLKGAHP